MAELFKQPRKVTSPFGPRKAPKPGASTFHRGTDFSFASGEPLAFNFPGTVSNAYFDRGGGNVLEFTGPDNALYKAMHLSQLPKLPKGYKFKPGEQVGYTGASGNVTGPHLHLEKWVGGKPVPIDEQSQIFNPSIQPASDSLEVKQAKMLNIQYQLPNADLSSFIGPDGTPQLGNFDSLPKSQLNLSSFVGPQGQPQIGKIEQNPDAFQPIQTTETAVPMPEFPTGPQIKIPDSRKKLDLSGFIKATETPATSDVVPPKPLSAADWQYWGNVSNAIGQGLAAMPGQGIDALGAGLNAAKNLIAPAPPMLKNKATLSVQPKPPSPLDVLTIGGQTTLAALPEVAKLVNNALALPAAINNAGTGNPNASVPMFQIPTGGLEDLVSRFDPTAQMAGKLIGTVGPWVLPATQGVKALDATGLALTGTKRALAAGAIEGAYGGITAPGTLQERVTPSVLSGVLGGAGQRIVDKLDPTQQALEASARLQTQLKKAGVTLDYGQGQMKVTGVDAQIPKDTGRIAALRQSIKDTNRESYDLSQIVSEATKLQNKSEKVLLNLQKKNVKPTLNLNPELQKLSDDLTQFQAESQQVLQGAKTAEVESLAYKPGETFAQYRDRVGGALRQIDESSTVQFGQNKLAELNQTIDNIRAGKAVGDIPTLQSAADELQAGIMGVTQGQKLGRKTIKELYGTAEKQKLFKQEAPMTYGVMREEELIKTIDDIKAGKRSGIETLDALDNELQTVRKAMTDLRVGRQVGSEAIDRMAKLANPKTISRSSLPLPQAQQFYKQTAKLLQAKGAAAQATPTYNEFISSKDAALAAAGYVGVPIMGVSSLGTAARGTARTVETAKGFQLAANNFAATMQKSRELVNGAISSQAKLLGLGEKAYQKKFIESGLEAAARNGASDAALKAAGLSADEIQKLRDSVINFRAINQDLNHGLLEKAYGKKFVSGTLDPDYVTQSERGAYIFNLDEAKFPIGSAERKALDAFAAQRGANPFDLHMFANSEREFFERMAKRMPGNKASGLDFLYDANGKFRSDLFKGEINMKMIQRGLDDTGMLSPQNQKTVKDGLLNSGLSNKQANQILSQIPKKGFGKSYSKFVGSMKKRQGKLLVPSEDGYRQSYLQAIDLAKKVYNEPVANQIQKAVQDIDQQIRSLRGIKDAGKRTKLVAEKLWLSDVEAVLLNKPNMIDTLLADAFDTIGDLKGLQWNSSKTARRFWDQYTAVESVAKLSLNMSASVMNLIEGARQGLIITDGAALKQLFDGFTSDPAAFVKNTTAEIKAHPLGDSILTHSMADFGFNSAFGTSKKFFGSEKLGKIKDAAMSPFTMSAQASKLIMYKMAAAQADAKGLSGAAKQDFVWDALNRMKGLTEVDPVLALRKYPQFARPLMLFKSFFARMLDSDLEHLSNVLKAPNSETVAMFAKSHLVPTMLFGAQSVPTFALGAAVASMALQPFVPGIDLLTWLRADKNPIDGGRSKLATRPGDSADIPGYLLGVLSRGVVGQQTPVDTSTFGANPLTWTDQAPLMVGSVGVASEFLADTFKNLSVAMQRPDLAKEMASKQYDDLFTALKDFVVPAKRIASGADIIQTQEIRDRGGTTVVKLTPEQAGFYGVMKMLGYNSSTITEFNSREAIIKQVERNRQSTLKTMRGEFEKAYQRGDTNTAKFLQEKAIKEYQGTNFLNSARTKARINSGSVTKEQLNRKELGAAGRRYQGL